MSDLHQALRNFFAIVLPDLKIQEFLLSALAEIVLYQSYEKGDILMQEGQYCKSLFIVKKGLVRRFTYENGKDITLEFAAENEFITSIYSVITSSPSLDTLQALEKSEILKIDVESINHLHNTLYATSEISRKIRDVYFLKLENRIRRLQNSSARERYNYFSQNQPHILQRASLGQIASYLGMTQETLSRIRRKK